MGGALTEREGQLMDRRSGVLVRAPAPGRCRPPLRPGVLLVVVALLAGAVGGCVPDISQVDRLRMEEAVGVGARFYERLGRGAYAEALAMTTLDDDETPEERIADLRRVDEELGTVQRARLAERTWDWTNGEMSFVLEYHVDRGRVVSDEVLKFGATGPQGELTVTGYGVDWDPDLVAPERGDGDAPAGPPAGP
jgi:hypothetical protein